MKTLLEWAPQEFRDFCDTRAYKLKDKIVVEEFGYPQSVVPAWPGPHKHVYNWCILESGHAVGWNENPSIGWSFPVIKLKK